MKKVILDFPSGRHEEIKVPDENIQFLIEWAQERDRIRDDMVVLTQEDIPALKRMLEWREEIINDIKPINELIEGVCPDFCGNIDDRFLRLIQTVKRIKKAAELLSWFYDNLETYSNLKICIIIKQKEVKMKSRFIEGVKGFIKSIDSLIFTWISPFLILLETLETFKGRRGL
ncbi:MAG: hypothetical protein DRI22_00055 [Caldiserica bacterium]|nr:MAG: hypothetical protein DRI22_00055 [Caldisericota bacterium]